MIWIDLFIILFVKYEKNYKERRRERRRLRSNCREARRDRDNGMSRTLACSLQSVGLGFNVCVAPSPVN